MEKIQSKLLALALAMFLVLANFAPVESSLAGESQGASQDFVYKEGNGIQKMVMKVFKDEKGYKILRSGSGYDNKWYPGSPLPNWSGRQGGSDLSPPPVP